jgi:hypothetical protein
MLNRSWTRQGTVSGAKMEGYFMASVVDTQLDSAASDILSQCGESATYTPVTGDPVSGVMVIPVEGVLLQPGTEAEVWAQGTTLDFLLADTGKVPARGDTFETSTTIYTVREVLENDGRWCKVQVK